MHETVEVTLTVNEKPRNLRVEPRETLAEVLREQLSLTGTKVSCDAQVCGACTVLVDGLAMSACTYLAVDADGKAVALRTARPSGVPSVRRRRRTGMFAAASASLNRASW